MSYTEDLVITTQDLYEDEITRLRERLSVAERLLFAVFNDKADRKAIRNFLALPERLEGNQHEPE